MTHEHDVYTSSHSVANADELNQEHVALVLSAAAASGAQRFKRDHKNPTVFQITNLQF